MSAKPLWVLSIAVNYNRIGFCYLIGKQPMDWQLTFKAATSAGRAEQKLNQWLDLYRPDVVITEAPRSAKRKGDRTKMLLDVVDRVVKRNGARHIVVERKQPYANRYDQIEDLCKRYPQMKAVAPKRRRYFDKEPPYVTIFDALAMAEQANK